MIEFSRLVKSFRYAWNGLKVTLREEQNFRIHVTVGILVIIAGFSFGISRFEWIALLIVMAGVLIGEMVNTIFERIVDVLKPRIHPFAEVVKDMMAGMVVISVGASVLVGILVFLPYILLWLGR